MKLDKKTVDGKFLEIYPNFKKFLDDNDKNVAELRKLCYKAACDEEILSNIRFCNDKFEIPPVRSFCAQFKDEIDTIRKNCVGEKLSDSLKRGLGAFWGSVFKGCLGYPRSENKPVPLKDFGVSTASFFYIDPDR
ncbi:MAG: hypothetical protein IK015_10195 [Treponema sp.]|nr:hypothetical protein [Treponema sp.]